jgi:UDP-galactose transporter B1
MLAEVKFVGLSVGLYVCFIYWGYLQEKVTSTKYTGPRGEVLEWNYAFALNLIMSASGTLMATVVELLTKQATAKSVPMMVYWRPALSSTLASPLGYAALNYISFPLVVLVKSCKPVPVILVGLVVYRRTYTWYKIVGVILLCAGIALFSSAKGGSVKSPAASGSGSSDSFNLGVGIVLVAGNLILDGFTNNEQDEIFSRHGATSVELMKYVNMWSVLYLATFLVVGYVMQSQQSELAKSLHVITSSAEARFDITMFCVCASVGQVLIFTVMKEFGSLAWITISITRKLFTILVSVFMFGHTIKPIQWVGIASVFAGMTVEVGMGYLAKAAKTDKAGADSDKKTK